MKKKDFLAIILIILFVFLIVPKTFQNDTFYTIKIGEDIIKYGFDGIEHHSWMSNLSYTSPHWLFDVINYVIYSVYNFDGLYIFTCVMSIITMILYYYLLRKKNINWLVSFAGTAITAFLIKDCFTDRAQIVSYMFLLLEIYLIEEFLKNKNIKSIIGIFLISVIIANVHAGVWYMLIIFILPYIAEYAFSLFALKNVTEHSLKRNEKKLSKLKNKKNINKETIEKLEKSIEFDKEFLKNYKPREGLKINIIKNDNCKYLILIILVIILGGLITPNGSFTYTYLIKLIHGNTTSYINEHQPIIVASSVEFVAFIIFTVTCIGFIDSKMTLSEGFLLLGLYFMTFIGKRHMILLILIGGPILIHMIDDFIQKNLNKDETWEKRKELTEKCLMILITVVVIRNRIKRI